MQAKAGLELNGGVPTQRFCPATNSEREYGTTSCTKEKWQEMQAETGREMG
jgi:hypothetical protein